MSRKGKDPIILPKGVTVTNANGVVTVKGPKGTLTLNILSCIDLLIEADKVTVQLKPEHIEKKNFHGLTRALIQNMVTGTTDGFEKKLEMIGVGYRAAVKGSQLDIQVGLSHPLLLDIPAGLKVSVEKNNLITIQGSDRQLVGQFAATVRAVKPPEVYQGKGIRYSGEYVRKKAGKAAAKAAA